MEYREVKNGAGFSSVGVVGFDNPDNDVEGPAQRHYEGKVLEMLFEILDLQFQLIVRRVTILDFRDPSLQMQVNLHGTVNVKYDRHPQPAVEKNNSPHQSDHFVVVLSLQPTR